MLIWAAFRRPARQVLHCRALTTAGSAAHSDTSGVGLDEGNRVLGALAVGPFADSSRRGIELSTFLRIGVKTTGGPQSIMREGVLSGRSRVEYRQEIDWAIWACMVRPARGGGETMKTDW